MWKDPAFYASIFLALVAVSALLYFVRKPLRGLLRMLFRSILGACLLILINTLGASHGWYMGVNPITAGAIGIFGVPGMAGLYLLKWLLG